MSRKVSYLSVFLIIFSSILLPVARSATPITDFDGTYTGKFTLTVTTTIPGNPPQRISKTVTVPMQMSVHNGSITGWGQGSIINKAGKATITVMVPPYGKITSTSYFSRNASTSIVNVTGTMSGGFPGVRVVVSGKFTATGGDKFLFSPRSLDSAKIGQKYRSGNSFCTPAVPNGQLCGLNNNHSDPSGGRPPYTFKLKSGSGFLPTGMTLNASTGTVSGTPISGQKTGIWTFVVCAYDLNDRFTGVCRESKMNLTR